jgi:hypothetical protein
VADDFSEHYGDLLSGSYDCVDRIVLKAYFPLGCRPGGVPVLVAAAARRQRCSAGRHPADADGRPVRPPG